MKISALKELLRMQLDKKKLIDGKIQILKKVFSLREELQGCYSVCLQNGIFWGLL